MVLTSRGHLSSGRVEVVEFGSELTSGSDIAEKTASVLSFTVSELAAGILIN